MDLSDRISASLMRKTWGGNELCRMHLVEILFGLPNLLLEGSLPGVQLEDLDAVQDLVHEFGPTVLRRGRKSAQRTVGHDFPYPTLFFICAIWSFFILAARTALKGIIRIMTAKPGENLDQHCKRFSDLSRTCERGWSEQVPKEVECERDLQRAGPGEVQVQAQVHELLRVDLHQVRRLAHCEEASQRFVKIWICK